MLRNPGRRARGRPSGRDGPRRCRAPAGLPRSTTSRPPTRAARRRDRWSRSARWPTRSRPAPARRGPVRRRSAGPEPQPAPTDAASASSAPLRSGITPCATVSSGSPLPARRWTSRRPAARTAAAGRTPPRRGSATRRRGRRARSAAGSPPSRAASAGNASARPSSPSTGAKRRCAPEPRRRAQQRSAPAPSPARPAAPSPPRRRRRARRPAPVPTASQPSRGARPTVTAAAAATQSRVGGARERRQAREQRERERTGREAADRTGLARDARRSRARPAASGAPDARQLARQGGDARAPQFDQRAAPRRIDVERAIDRPAERHRQIAALALQRRGPLTLEAGGHRRRRAPDRVEAGEALVDRQGQRVQVRRRVRRTALGLLGRHVGERPDDVARPRQRLLAGDPRHAEVGQLGRRSPGRRLVGDDHVLRLDVPVDDPAGVGMGERVGQHDADPQELAVADPPGREQLCKARPADRLGDEVVGVLVGPGLIQRDDRRVAEPRRRDRLAPGPPALLPAVRRSSAGSA